MEASVCIGILEQAVFVLVEHAHLLVFLFLRPHKIIGIDEVVARVIRRVDINHLHLAEIAFLQEFEHFQIVALDVEVFGTVPVFAFFDAWAQRLADGLVGFHNRRLFANPRKFVCFVAVHHVGGKHLLEQFKIDGAFVYLLLLRAAFLVQLFRHAVREKGGDAVDVLGGQVGGFKFRFVHSGCLRYCCLQIFPLPNAYIHPYLA